MENKKTCLVCGSPIRNRHNLKYCSVACKNIGIGHKVRVVCRVCGKAILVSPYRSRTKRYCSKACQGIAYSHSKPKKINYESPEQLGYFCGLVLGDGCLQLTGKAPNKSKRIGFYSTDPDLIQLFSEAGKTILPEGHLGGTWRRKSSGFRVTKPLRQVWVYSRELYDLLKPWRQPHTGWQIPSFLTSPESIKGFLQGIFDTDGGITYGKVAKAVKLTCKSEASLNQVAEVLHHYGIRSYVNKNGNSFNLTIKGCAAINKFASCIGFRLPRKKDKLLSLVKAQTPYYEAVGFLEEKGPEEPTPDL